MQTYRIPLVPGPTIVPQAVREAYLVDYGSADIEPEYAELYARLQIKLQQILGTRNQLAIMSGEGMLALWGALKSCIRPGDRVLAVSTGVFGAGVGDMARQIGADVQTVDFAFNTTADPQRVSEAIRAFRPKMVTAIHCETPSGTLNPIAEIGGLVRAFDVPLFYVDAVASAGGAPLRADDWGIDLCLTGSQKCLSALPDMSVVSISERAWQAIDEVDYAGYDALKPWRTALADRWFPYTPAWQNTAALDVACRLLLEEGLEPAIARHDLVAAYCRQRIRGMGLDLFSPSESDCSPTVTAVRVPERMGWPALDQALRARGMVVGGSLGPLANTVFRIGHMGAQANMALLRLGMDTLEEVWTTALSR
jgi:aspartate aminotransferase-like enzyme